MKDKVDIFFEIVQIILGFALIIGIVIGIVKCSNYQESAKWNNGYCECGGHWEYEQAVGHHYSTSYIYRCAECGKRLEVRSVQTEVEEVEE